MQRIPNFEALEKNIVDVIIEQQIKLGYREETIRLYYPIESLNHILEIERSEADLNHILNQFCALRRDRFGELKYTCKEKRYCILIPPQGVTYVHENGEDNSFLKALIETISTHVCTLEDILAVFQRYSAQVICKKVTNGEFDYVLYFEDESPDAYRYCIKFEACHVIYHRFTKSDYETFQF